MSISEDNGFLWQTLWNHADNAGLKQLRENPNVLFPGDTVVIPDKKPRFENAATDQLHSYVKKSNLAQVRLRLLDVRRRPRPNVQYTATVDAVVSTGHTDDAGYITLSVPPNASQLKLTVQDGSRTEDYNLPLGSIDPIEELSGVQQRLVNLGYPCGSEEDLGELTKTAIRAFQTERNLAVTGDLDDTTRQALKQIHGC